MSNLTNTQIQNTYGGVINIGPSGASASLEILTDGLGNALPLEISTSGVNFTGFVTGVSQTSYIKNLEVTFADITYDGTNSNADVVFADPMPTTSYSIFFTWAIDPNDIGSSKEFWYCGSELQPVYYINKTDSGFTIVWPGQDYTGDYYNQFLGYATCSLIQEI